MVYKSVESSCPYTILVPDFELIMNPSPVAGQPLKRCTSSVLFSYSSTAVYEVTVEFRVKLSKKARSTVGIF